MVAQKPKILSKRTVRESAPVTFSDTKQGFTVPRGKQGCTEIGLCNICKFLYVFIVFLFTSNWILSTRHDFSYGIRFEKLSVRNRWLIKKIILIFFDDKNQETKSCACLGQTCSRSLIVFLSQLFVVVLIIFVCFWRIHFSEICDESTVWVGFLCRAAGYILSSPRFSTS